MVTGRIFDIKKFSIHDGPGIRTTVFLQGCPLRCWWCHNPESQAAGLQVMLSPDKCIGCRSCLEVCPEGAIHEVQGALVTDRSRCRSCGTCVDACYSGARRTVGTELTADELMEEIERDVVFYDQSGGGVTFSGGEPLMQPRFLGDILQRCREHDLRTVVDTSGYAATEDLVTLSPLVDAFLFDLKVIDDAKHRKYTGVSNERILANLRALAAVHNDVIVRIPIIPGINDDEQNIARSAEFVTSLGRIREIDILPYHKTGSAKYRRLGKPYFLPDVEPPTEAVINGIARSLRDRGFVVKVGG